MRQTRTSYTPCAFEAARHRGSGLAPDRFRAPSMNPRFVVSGCSIVGQAIPIGGVDIGAIEVLRRDEKLFSHFGEAGTAIFLIQEI